MIKNTAFLAALTIFLLTGWIAGALVFLAPYKRAIFAEHGRLILGSMLLVFFHLCALYYAVARWLFLRETGRKLTHVDQQFMASEQVQRDLPTHLWSARG